MTYDLYWVSVLGYIVITLIILIRERKYTHHAEKAGRVFMPLGECKLNCVKLQ